MTRLDSLADYVCGVMSNDSAHDFEHIMRVYKNAQMLCDDEGVDSRLVLPAVLLHDLVSLPKSSELSGMSSELSAKKSHEILAKYDFTADEIVIITDAIRDHSFSQNKTPASIEGKILQDADRLDALGAIGIARVFATGGVLGRPFYNTDDPFCVNRSPDDKTWTVDHFFAKLLKLESLMNTESGRVEAEKRTLVLKAFLSQLKLELQF